jgi:hypothetical protein
MEQRLSKEYEEFLEEFRLRKMTFYEGMCASFEGLMPLNPPNAAKIQEAINFAHMNLTPRGSFALCIFFAILFPAFFLSVGFLLNILTPAYIILIATFTLAIFWYLYSLPLTLATSFRIRASSEMVLAIVYMTIAMKVVPNIEYAIKFTATNLRGPLARDLKKIIWDVYTGKQTSMLDALDPFMEKWKRESEEFTKAIFLIKSSFFESSERRNKVLNEAVSVVLNGTKERMKHYAQDLKAPITVLNALGILLPVIGLVFFPIMSIFLPDLIQPAFLVIGYNIMLPIVIYWMMKTYLEKRPATFHQPDISRHPQFMKEKLFNLIFILSIIIPSIIVALSYWQITLIKDPVSFPLLAYSLAITWAISGGIIIYTIFTTRNKLKLREDIIQIESELGEVLFQLGQQVTRGLPIENALKESLPRIRELKISKMIEKIMYNMETFGMTFTASVFDKNAGAINYYPSNLIEAVMKAVTEISKGGMVVLSDAMLSISTYLKNMHEVEEELKSLLEDVSSNMSMQALLLAPMSAAIVVALTAMVIQLVQILKIAVDKIQSQLTSYGPLGSMGNGFLGSILQVNKIIPIQNFQLIVGFYLVEVVVMISIFTSIINYGEDKLLRKYNLGKLLLYGMLIYSGVLLLIYFAFTSLMPIGNFLK